MKKLLFLINIKYKKLWYFISIVLNLLIFSSQTHAEELLKKFNIPSDALENYDILAKEQFKVSLIAHKQDYFLNLDQKKLTKQKELSKINSGIIFTVDKKIIMIDLYIKIMESGDLSADDSGWLVVANYDYQPYLVVWEADRANQIFVVWLWTLNLHEGFYYK